MSTPMPPDDRSVDQEERLVVREQAPVERVVVNEAAAAPEVVTTVTPGPAVAHSEHVSVDHAAEQRAALSRVNGIVWFVIGLIEALIGIRVVLRLIAANPDNAFAQFIYSVTGPFVAPFMTLTGTPAYNGSVLEVGSLIAMIVYALVGWAVTKLLSLLFFRPTTRSASSSTYEQN